MTRLSEKEKEYLQYLIYSFRYDNPWVSNKEIAKSVNRSIVTVNRYALKSELERVILGPDLRLKPCPGRKAALLRFEDKFRAFKELYNYPGVGYLILYQGHWNIQAIYDEPVDFEKTPGYIQTLAEGVFGEVLTPKVGFTSWECCYKKMEDFLRQSKTIEKSSLNCSPRHPDWDDKDFAMYDYFKLGLRKEFNQLRKTMNIPWGKYCEWKKNLRNYCTILMGYYPRGRDTYVDITFRLQTKYQKFIVDLFSLLPSTSCFSTIEDSLMATVFVPRGSRHPLKIFETISYLKDCGIIDSYMDGYVIIHWSKEYLHKLPVIVTLTE